MWQTLASYVLGWFWREKPWRELRGKQHIEVHAEMEELDAQGNPLKRVSASTKMEKVGGPSTPST